MTEFQSGFGLSLVFCFLLTMDSAELLTFLNTQEQVLVVQVAK